MTEVAVVEPIEQRIAGGLELLAELERLGAATPTTLDLPPDLSFDRFEAVGMALGRGHRNICWKIGDWLNYGEFTYRHKYSQAAEILNMQPQTLQNYARTARAIHPERRRPELPFSVHSLVAALTPVQQTKWLNAAVEQKWRRDELNVRLHPEVAVSILPEVGAPDIEESARDLVRSAKVSGDVYVVGRASFIQLCAALGETP